MSGINVEIRSRIINAIKITNTVIFSADEGIRAVKDVLQDYMPWMTVEIYANPYDVNSYRSEKTTVFILDDTGSIFIDTDRIRKNNNDCSIVLLSANETIHTSPPSIAAELYPHTKKADLVFAVNTKDMSPEKIITSVVRCAEDRINILNRPEVRRYIFLMIDDEPRWISQFLPVLYKIIGLRADVMVTRTYEETIKFIFGVTNETDISTSHQGIGYGDDIVCIISDIFFPKGNVQNYDSGRYLVKIMNQYFPRIPIIIASKSLEASTLKDIAFILPKGDPGSLETFDTYIHDLTGLGDFILRDSEGVEKYRAKDITEIYDLLNVAQEETTEGLLIRDLLNDCGHKDYFSTWLYMHGYSELGDILRPKRHQGAAMITLLKRYLKREINKINKTPLIIDGKKIYSLPELHDLLQEIDPGKIQKYSDYDLFSTWLDRLGYTELADEFRPIHGSGNKLKNQLLLLLERWMNKYRNRFKPLSGDN
ncbi:hypothetical protein JXB12_11285 [candidate division KSB1 bacterium]|nr:hypothetical protein [candidate division KSB1 bacterium]